jgi:phosphoribosylformimino-5-aminoimidazole carboxamide ribonucleotide (ProFAR) isomerase
MSFRIGATILLNCNGENTLQSYNFQTRRVLGGVKNTLSFLDKYEVDEIHLIIPSKGINASSFKALNKLRDISISTPLSVGGGINIKGLSEITKDPFFERLIFNSALFDDHEVIKQATLKMGHQAIVAYVPFILKNNKLKVYYSKINKFIDTSNRFWEDLNLLCNEVILLDANAEGNKKGFNFNVFEFLKFPTERVLISGGIKKLDISKAKEMKLAGVSIDNATLHSEFSIKGLR